jgi:hypothetical protein
VVAQQSAVRLVVVGEAGSGKSTLARRIALTMLGRRGPNDPVPIVLPISLWRPGYTLRDLTVDELGGDSIRGLRDLAAHGHLFYVLDGLGDGSQPAAADVLTALHRELAAGHGLVLTCRSEAYSAVVAARPLPGTVVATVQPLRPTDVATWLPSDLRWRSVIEDITKRPDGPLATALSTPEVASLTRIGYAKDGDPGELVACDSRSLVEERVLDRFLRGLDMPAAAQRWLAFLAGHLHRSRTFDLAWWALPAAVPEAVRGLFGQLSSGVLLGSALGLATASAALFWFGLGFGLLFGLQAWPRRGRGGAIAWRAAIVTMFTLAIAEVYQPVIGAAVGGGMGILVSIGYGRRSGAIVGGVAVVGSALTAWLPGELIWSFLIGGFLAFTTGIAFWAVFAEVRHRPARVGLRLRGATVASFLRRFAGGLGASLFATIIVALVGWAGVAFALAIGVACGLAAGCTVWHEATATTYQTDPTALLRRDRAAAFVGGAVTGTLLGLGTWLALALFVHLSNVRAFDASDTIPVGIVAGLAAGIATMLSRSWGGFALARVWFRLTGRLPRRIMAFLAEMHARGILMQYGGRYRFRSSRHQQRLASGMSTLASPTPSSPQ